MNHKWDKPKNKIYSDCVRCGITRFTVNKKYGNYEYRLKDGRTTLTRPECNPIETKQRQWKPNN